ncbi:MAG: ABC transporter permease [Putridiphycobacter sp.]
MNTEFFIAKKIIKKDKSKDKVSKPIVAISLTSISLGVAIMIITVSIVTGFQEKIREKVIGFGSHIQITKLTDNTSMESTPILKSQDFVEELRQQDGVKHVQTFAYKPAILQTELDSTIFNVNGQDTVLVNRDILGVLFKGIDDSYDLNFFNDKLTQGENIDSLSHANEILISEFISQKLHYKVGDKVSAYFVLNSGPKKRNFKVKGIYKTGMEDFDKKIIFCQQSQIQQINNWGVQTFLTLADTCIDHGFVLEAKTYGDGDGFAHDWGNGFSRNKYYLLNGHDNHEVQVISHTLAYYLDHSYQVKDTIPDTASAKIIVENPCFCSEEILESNPIEYESDSVILAPFGKIYINNGKGTGHLYTGGFEVIINQWDDLDKMDDIIYNTIPFELQSSKITDLNPEIFNWLGFLDMNIAVILTLMIIVSLINMITSLLVLILEKINMIGILKAIGANNWSIRKIFLYNSFYLLVKGLFWGNLIGLALLMIQKIFQVVPLDPNVYYLDTVPVSLNIWHVLAINLLTIITTMIILIVPSYLVSKINPVKSIKFN